MDKTRFSKTLRQQIIEEYVARRGEYDPKSFVAEVREVGPSHAAYDWFEWNNTEAADQYRFWQARMFVQGIRVKVEIEHVERKIAGVRVLDAVPAYVSPIAARKDGGGYFKLDPENPSHIRELRMQAIVALDNWIRRYGAVYSMSGGAADDLQRIKTVLAGSDTPPAPEIESDDFDLI